MESIWKQTYEIASRPSLCGDIRAEAVVIGAGMTGILTAWQLQREGIRTVVLEADRIASGQTGHTTAKITAQHGDILADFVREKGFKTAAKYVRANLAAVKEYERIISGEGISCDFEKTDSYVYGQEEERMKEEAKVSRQLGAPAFFVKDISFPVSHKSAVRFSDQAQFHPLKFADALARSLTIYEKSPVKEVEDHKVITPGGSVAAKHIIFAAHFPFVNFPGMYFARMHQERSYVLAISGAGTIDGMYIGTGKKSYSFRQYGKWILFGGEAHRTGENAEGGKYEKLKRAAENFFPGCRVEAAWSAQDCMTADKIPFVGTYASSKPGWYVASGFQKWGMTSSMAAAMILRDQICERPNPYADAFAPARFSVGEIGPVGKDTGTAVKQLVSPIFRGGIRCSHLGCRLVWNPDEQTWDCPCHGSRFDRQGRKKEGPAQKGICCKDAQ